MLPLNEPNTLKLGISNIWSAFIFASYLVQLQISCSVMTNVPIAITSEGHAPAHFPHLIHCSSLVTGDIASKGAVRVRLPVLL